MFFLNNNPASFLNVFKTFSVCLSIHLCIYCLFIIIYLSILSFGLYTSSFARWITISRRIIMYHCFQLGKKTHCCALSCAVLILMPVENTCSRKRFWNRISKLARARCDRMHEHKTARWWHSGRRRRSKSWSVYWPLIINQYPKQFLLQPQYMTDMFSF